MRGWTLHSVTGGQVTYRRMLHERFAAYVDHPRDPEGAAPLSYRWSVQDGSCGRTLAQDWVDGESGLAAAQRAADAAAAALFGETR